MQARKILNLDANAARYVCFRGYSGGLNIYGKSSTRHYASTGEGGEVVGHGLCQSEEQEEEQACEREAEEHSEQEESKVEVVSRV